MRAGRTVRWVATWSWLATMACDPGGNDQGEIERKRLALVTDDAGAESTEIETDIDEAVPTEFPPNPPAPELPPELRQPATLEEEFARIVSAIPPDERLFVRAALGQKTVAKETVPDAIADKPGPRIVTTYEATIEETICGEASPTTSIAISHVGGELEGEFEGSCSTPTRLRPDETFVLLLRRVDETYFVESFRSVLYPSDGDYVGISGLSVSIAKLQELCQ
jgi:hypothetical protein